MAPRPEGGGGGGGGGGGVFSLFLFLCIWCNNFFSLFFFFVACNFKSHKALLKLSTASHGHRERRWGHKDQRPGVENKRQLKKNTPYNKQLTGNSIVYLCCTTTSHKHFLHSCQQLKSYELKVKFIQKWKSHWLFPIVTTRIWWSVVVHENISGVSQRNNRSATGDYFTTWKTNKLKTNSNQNLRKPWDPTLL